MVSENKIEIKNYRLFIFFQISIFFLSLVILYRVISKILEKRLSVIIISVLLLNPIIFQWHLSFLTESLFLSVLIFSICSLLKSKNFFHFFLLGILIGILYMLRTIALLYPLVLVIYLLLLIPGFIFMNNGLFCRYYFFLLLIIYTYIYKSN